MIRNGSAVRLLSLNKGIPEDASSTFAVHEALYKSALVTDENESLLSKSNA